MLSSKFDNLFGELVVVPDNYADARSRNDVSDAFSTRSQLHDLRQQLAAERANLTV